MKDPNTGIDHQLALHVDDDKITLYHADKAIAIIHVESDTSDASKLSSKRFFVMFKELSSEIQIGDNMVYVYPEFVSR